MIKKLFSVIFVLFVAVQSIIAIDFKCDYVYGSWYFFSNVKNCYGRKVDIREKNLDIETINGKPAIKDSTVVGWWIADEIIHYLPRGIENFFPNLQAFGIHKSELKEISKFDLAAFPDLARFTLTYNQVEFVESDLFMYNPKLKSVTLYESKLFIIGHNIFESKNQLIKIQIEIGCLDIKCENEGSCMENVISDIKKKCPSDTLIGNFKRENQRLENELKLSKEREETLIATCDPDINIRLSS